MRNSKRVYAAYNRYPIAPEIDGDGDRRDCVARAESARALLYPLVYPTLIRYTYTYTHIYIHIYLCIDKAGSEKRGDRSFFYHFRLYS